MRKKSQRSVSTNDAYITTARWHHVSAGDLLCHMTIPSIHLLWMGVLFAKIVSIYNDSWCNLLLLFYFQHMVIHDADSLALTPLRPSPWSTSSKSSDGRCHFLFSFLFPLLTFFSDTFLHLLFSLWILRPSLLICREHVTITRQLLITERIGLLTLITAFTSIRIEGVLTSMADTTFTSLKNFTSFHFISLHSMARYLYNGTDN